MKRLIVFGYGAACYAVFFATFLYLIAFLADRWVPISVDTARSSSWAVALAIDLALLALFGIQHSGMARPSFKRAWTRIVPAPIERSTYVLLSSLVLIAAMWQWRVLPGVLWNVTDSTGASVLWILFALGWVLILISTFLIDHFDLFGLKQTYYYARRRQMPAPAFKVTSLYRIVRHPLYVGWLIAFWATPRMTVGHALFAALLTTYVLVAIRLEERDLVAVHGRTYEDYQRDVPMLMPVRGMRHPRVVAEPELARSNGGDFAH